MKKIKDKFFILKDKNDFSVILNAFTRNIKIVNRKMNKLTDEEIYSYFKDEIYYFDDLKEYKAALLKINNLTNVYFNITYRCNLHCNYCYAEHSARFVKMKDLTIILNNLIKLNPESITLIGGEPFCYPDFDKVLSEILNHKEFKEIRIVTNGTLLSQYYSDLYNDPRITFQVSLDGYNDESNSQTRDKGSFDTVIKGIECLIKNKKEFSVMETITRSNIEHSPDFYKYFHRRGIPCGFL